MARDGNLHKKKRDILRNDLPIMHPTWRWTLEDLETSDMTPAQKQDIIDRMWEEFDE
jgi:hypothetical protein